jgi:Tol biopolymer transport system component
MSPGDTPSQLWMADTRSDKNYALTSGTLGRFAPSISPDGAHLIFGEVLASQAIVSIDLATAAVHATVNTGRSLQMPSWARTKPVFAYVSNRNGPTEIWLHGPGDVDAPVVSASGPAKWLMGPSLSAHAERIVYSVVDPEAGATHLWMSAAAGGAPVRLTNDDHGSEFPGSWSPDGAWFVYQAIHKNRLDLMKVRASGGASPVVLKSDLSPEREGVPVWSPAGDWIAFDDGGEKLISPNGAPVRDLGKHGSVAMGFDAAGKRLYGMRAESGKNLLFWIDTTSGSETVVGGAGPGNLPGSELNPALLLSLAPDGKSFLYGTSTGKENLWMLSGFSK